MNYTLGSPTSLIPAQPGIYITPDSASSAAPQYEVIGWAVVVTDYDGSGRARTVVEPVFLYEGVPYTETAWRQDMKPKQGLEVMTP